MMASIGVAACGTPADSEFASRAQGQSVTAGSTPACAALTTHSTTTLDVIPTKSRTLSGFSGFATEDIISAMSPTLGAYQSQVRGLLPAFLRIPAGTPSEAYSYATGAYVSSWYGGWWYGGETNQYGEWGHFLDVMSPKPSLSTYASLSRAVGAGAVVYVINTANDTGTTAGQIAAWCYANGVTCDYELGNEPYADNVSAHSSNWATKSGSTWTHSGASYMSFVRPYVDAIVANDPRTTYDVIVPLNATNWEDTSSPFTSWDDGGSGVLDFLNADNGWSNQGRVSAVSVHSYPCGLSGSSTIPGIESCLMSYLYTYANPWASNLVKGAAGRKVYVTEFNSGVEGNTTDIDRPDLHYPGSPTYIRGRQFNAMWAASALLQYAYAGIYRVGFQKLYGDYFAAIDAKDHHLADVYDSWSTDPSATVDTTSYAWNLYYTATGEALRIVNGAMNQKDGLYPVSIGGGDGHINSLAFGNGDGHYAVLAVNNGSYNEELNVRVKGESIGSSTMYYEWGSGTDPDLSENWMNGTTPANRCTWAKTCGAVSCATCTGAWWLAGDSGGTDNTSNVAMSSCAATHTVSIGPYAVVQLWF